MRRKSRLVSTFRRAGTRTDLSFEGHATGAILDANATAVNEWRVMSKQNQLLDPEFIQQQRERLEALQLEIQTSREFREEDELQLQASQRNQSHDSGGDAQTNALQDNDRAVRAHALMRLQVVRRALEKIEDGSYGRSDQSGDPIPQDRLVAMPSSLFTVEEEEARERDAQRND